MGNLDVKYLQKGDLVWVTAIRDYGYWRKVGVQVRVQSVYGDGSGAWCEFGKTCRPTSGEDGSAYDAMVFEAVKMSFKRPSMCDSYEYFDGKREKGSESIWD